MRRLLHSGLLIVALAVSALGPSPAGAQTPAPNRIVVYTTFGNAEPPADAMLTVHLTCSNITDGSGQPVVDQTATVTAPWDPVTFEVPVLAASGELSYVSCFVKGEWANVTGGFPEITCGVAEPGTPPPDPPPPSGCGALSRNTYTDAYFPATVSGAVYNVIFTMLLPTPTPAPEIVSTPAFTG